MKLRDLVRGRVPLKTRQPRPRQFRAESFGGIVQLERPRALVFVDRDYVRSLGADDGGTWTQPASDGVVGAEILSAPLEAHLQLTNACDVGCSGCYTGATPGEKGAEWGAVQWKRALDELATMGVFHLALGGGESADLPWLGEIARHARSLGMIPNLTTSGLSNMDRLLGIADLFGQINVSIDGMRSTYARVRGVDGFERADASVRALRRQKKEVGINVVVTRHNFAELDRLFAYAKARRLNEIELLRFKPSGRGRQVYHSMRCSDDQHRRFFPTVKAAMRRHRLRARIDCSYVPMLAYHDPGPEFLASMAVYGCSGGDFLIGAKATGAVTACSFAPADRHAPKVDELTTAWGKDELFADFRGFRDADEPCRSCAYHSLCRGGCRVVSLFEQGTLRTPDPECPRVVDRNRRPGTSPRNAIRLPVVR